MYVINKGIKNINGKVVGTFERKAVDGNTTLRVKAGTTGCRGAAGRAEAAPISA